MNKIPKAHRPYGACYDCGRRYGEEFGFPDLLIPTGVWNRIMDNDNEPVEGAAGLLCPCCIVKRCVLLGIETTATWASGPFSEDPVQPPQREPGGWVVECSRHCEHDGQKVKGLRWVPPCEEEGCPGYTRRCQPPQRDREALSQLATAVRIAQKMGLVFSEGLEASTKNAEAILATEERDERC